MSTLEIRIFYHTIKEVIAMVIIKFLSTIITSIFSKFLDIVKVLASVATWKGFVLIISFMLLLSIGVFAFCLHLYNLQIKTNKTVLANVTHNIYYHQLEHAYINLPLVLQSLREKIDADAVMFVVYMPDDGTYFAHSYVVVGNQNLVKEDLRFNKILTSSLHDEINYISIQRDHYVRYNYSNAFLAHKVGTYIDVPVMNQNNGFLGSIIVLYRDKVSLNCNKKPNFEYKTNQKCLSHQFLNNIRDASAYIMGSTYSSEMAIEYVYHNMRNVYP